MKKTAPFTCEAAILCVLARMRKALTGSEINEEILKKTRVDFSPGTLYPALSKLSCGGYLCRIVDKDFDKRPRYSLTVTGEELYRWQILRLRALAS